MKKAIIVFALAFITHFTVTAQIYKTPSVVNMSKNYLPFNAVKLDLNTQKLTISVKFKSDIHFTIKRLNVNEQKGQKRYFIETEEDSYFTCTVTDDEIVLFTAFADKSVDWILSK